MKEELATYVMLVKKNPNGSKKRVITRLDANNRVARPCDALIEPCVGWSLRELREREGWEAYHQWQTAQIHADSKGRA